MMQPIDYAMIGKAIERYTKLGYEYLETPWWVSAEAQYTTMPKHIRSFVIDEYKYGGFSVQDGEPTGHLVGSAEQSLIQYILDEKIKPGLYVMAGPCFRNEPVLDEFHLQSFFKVELACVFKEGEAPYVDEMRMMHDVQLIMASIAGVIPEVMTMSDNQGYDLTVNGVEVGSYGRRFLNGLGWVYGTGLALPRLTQALQRG